jgi:DNA repair photolyase
LRFLHKFNIEAWLLTRGSFQPELFAVLRMLPRSVRVTIGLTTLERNLQLVLEPFGSSPAHRCRAIGSLRQAGVKTRVALQPLVPSVTDTRANLVPLLETLAGLGIRHVTAGYLAIDPLHQPLIVNMLDECGWADRVLAEYLDGPVLRIGRSAPARLLPRTRRQRGYAGVMALAADYGITVSVCRFSNPDFHPAAAAIPAPSAPAGLFD